MSKDQEILLEQLSFLMGAGVSIREAFLGIPRRGISRSFAKSLDGAVEKLNEGVRFSVVLEQEKLIPAHMIPMLRVAEEAGLLSSHMKLLLESARRDQTFRDNMKSALIYPALVVVLTVVVVVCMAWFTLPKLVSVFATLDGELPMFTLLLIATGDFFRIYGFIAVPLFFVLSFFFLYLLFVYPRTRYAGEWILFSIPPIRALLLGLETARMSHAFGTLLRAGIPVLQIFEIVRDGARWEGHKRLYTSVRATVSEGTLLSRAFYQDPHAQKYLSEDILPILVAGEQSGSLPEAFLSIASSYDERLKVLIGTVTKLIEPIIILGVGLVVGAVTLGIIEPVYTLIDEIK